MRSSRRVLFRRNLKKPNMPPGTGATSSSTSSFSTNRPAKDEDEEDAEEEIISSTGFPAFMIPDLFARLPPVRDGLETKTSKDQDATADVCLPYLKAEINSFSFNDFGVPRLDRPRHINFLHGSLDSLPSRFVAADASRPWYLYWSLSGLTMLGEDVSHYRDAVVDTARSMQNDTGGFGGGGRQLSHLATTYAIVLALALVGGEDAYQVIDRKGMWKWLCSLKQPDGGFQVCLGGEEDIRGAYCAAVIINLLNIPLDLTPESPAWSATGNANLLTGVEDYVRRCQTFEGGISGQPDCEAHGAYAFCALGCLALLGHPREIIPRYLDVPRLVSWLSSRQYAPEGGFCGRTNKLVDGCYSHWVGACFPLIEACLGSGEQQQQGDTAGADPGDHRQTTTKLRPVSETLFSREGLIRYILCCCQDEGKRGGLRDKPGKYSDAYHTCYVLSGLSAAQHQWMLTSAPPPETPAGTSTAATGNAVEWTVVPYYIEDEGALFFFDMRDRVRPIHPVYAIPLEQQQAIRSYFEEHKDFS